MSDVKEHREQDRQRLEACDRFQAACAAADRASAYATRASEMADKLHREARALREAAFAAEYQLKELLKPPSKEAVVEQAAGVCATDSPNSPDGCNMRNSSPSEELSHQEYNVWCMAYQAERAALGPSDGASERAREAAHGAVRAFRMSTRKP